MPEVVLGRLSVAIFGDRVEEKNQKELKARCYVDVLRITHNYVVVR
jgi:hypothetical protein